MANTIRIEAQDSASDVLRKIAQGLDTVGDQADSAGKSVDGFDDSLEQADPAALERDVKELTDDLNELERQAREVARELNRIDEPTATASMRITALSTSIVAGIKVAKKLTEGMRFLGQEIQRLADNGNARFQSLAESMSGVQSAYEEMILGFQNTDIGGGFLDAVQSQLDGIAGGLKALPDLYDSVAFSAASAYEEAEASLASLLGVQQQSNRATSDSIKIRMDERQSAIAAARAEADRVKSEQLAKELLESFDKSRAEAAEARRIGEIQSYQQVLAEIAKQRESIRQLASEGKLQAEQAQDAARKLQTLEQRRLALLDESKAEYRAAREEQERQIRELAEDKARREQEAAQAAIAAAERESAEKEKLRQREQQEAIKAHEARLRAAQEAAQKQIDIEKAKIDAIAKLASGRDGEQQSLIERIRGGIDQRQVFQRVADNRSREALARFREENKDQFSAAHSDDRLRRQLEAQMERIRRDVTRQTFRQGNMGMIGEQERQQATGQLTQQVIAQGRQSGQLGDSVARGLSQAAKTLQEAIEQQQEQGQQIEEITRILRQQQGDVKQSRQAGRREAQSLALRR